MYPFNHMRNTAQEGDPSKFHPWHVLPMNLKAMARSERASSYSQSDMPKLAKSGTRLVFASITPIEQGFLYAHPDEPNHAPFLSEALRLLSGRSLREGFKHFLRRAPWDAGRALLGILRNQGPLRLVLQKLFMRYSWRRIRHMLSDQYDYWDEYLREYAFFCAANDQPHGLSFPRPHPSPPHRTIWENIEGRYRLIQNASQLQSTIEHGQNTDIAVILTIEGSHTFSIAPDQQRVPEPVLFDRIRALKAQPHPILFITFAHHFDNGLCGHARSLIAPALMVMDQSRRLNEGLEPDNDLGLRAALALLGLRSDLSDSDEPRILLDLKHASARTRQDLYRLIYAPYNAAHTQRADATNRPKLPVIFSHAAFSDARSLADFIHNLDHENDHWRRAAFNAWSINVCDEDVRMIHSSEGLLGLCFDQRILGVRSPDRVPAAQCARALLRQVLAFVDVILLDDRIPPAERASIWDRLCIGTDFDGFIDPLNPYPTALAFPDFANDLRAFLEEHRHTRMIDSIGVEVLVEKICWRNAYQFALTHLPAAVHSPTK